MADLSPAALTVWDRFCGIVEDHGPPRLGLAAALRAAADAIEPIDITPDHAWLLEQLIAIAAELEAQG